MEITELKNRPGIEQNKKLYNLFNQFNGLLTELRKRKLPDEIVHFINAETRLVNTVTGTEMDLKKQIRKSQSHIVNQLEKKLKLVTKNYYRKIYLAIGISAIGLPIGVAIGNSFGNMGLLGVGMVIGMAIGIISGSLKDKKAFKEGRQLDIELE